LLSLFLQLPLTTKSTLLPYTTLFRSRKEVLRQSIGCCYAGTVKERQFVKQFIHRLLTGQANVFMPEYRDGCVNITVENYKYIFPDRKSTRLNSSHVSISYAVFCLKKK